MHTKESTSTSSSDSELDIATARQVYYIKNVVRPLVSTFEGVTIVSWIPIARSPVSSRTRARTKR